MKAFSEWLTTSELGQYLLTREKKWFDQAAADVFGYCAVQVGVPEMNFLEQNRIPWQCRTSEYGAGQLRCDPAQLPFETRSLDLIVLPHVLDFTRHPHLVLREVERVLVPGGRLLLTGFNPLSLWGVGRLIQGRDIPPWHGNFFTLVRIKDWLSLLDLEPVGGAFMAYAPPLSRREWIKHFHFLEKAGDRWWPLAAGVYGIKAVKRQRGMHVILPHWKSAKAQAGLVTMGNHGRHPLPKKSQDTQSRE